MGRSRWPRGLRQWTVFALSNTGVVGSNLTRGMDVCVPLFCICAVAALQWADPRSRSPTDYVKDQETVKSGKAQQKGCTAIDGRMDRQIDRY
jgi:hypothetical protein